MLEDLQVEGLEADSVIEMAQVRELVTQCVHEARVLERLARDDVPEPDADGAVGEADAVATLDVGAFGLDGSIPQLEAAGEPLRIAVEALHETRVGSVPHQSR